MSVDDNSESRMRELLGEHATRGLAHTPELDADAIISRARRRRLPGQVAIGGASALAVVGLLTIAVPAITGVGLGGEAPMSASTFSEMDSVQRDHEQAPDANGAIENVDLMCTSPLNTSAISGLEMTLEARSVTGVAGEWRIDADIVLRNTGESSLSVDLEAAIFTLGQDGSTVGAHYGGVEGEPAMLAPGGTSTYTVNFEPMPCGSAGALSGEFELWVTVLIDGETVTSTVPISSP